MTFTHPRDAGPDHPGYVTRDGRPARIVCTDVKGTNGGILALVDRGVKEWTVWLHQNGRVMDFGEDAYDLLDAPKPQRSGTFEVYVIVRASEIESIFLNEYRWRKNFLVDDLARFVVSRPWNEGEGL